jgi:enoyl-CoA hydratase
VTEPLRRITSMTFETLVYSIENRVATVTVNRPEKMNALNAEARRDLRRLFSSIRVDPSVDVVILTGAGEKAFVAGADISEFIDLTRQGGKEFSADGQGVFDIIENLGKPVISAVNGYALGGGCELALACHFRLASEKARFGHPEVTLGIIPGFGGTQRLARIIGIGRALELMLTGEIIDADEAYRIGLVNKVFPSGDLLARAIETARLITRSAQMAVRLALRATLGSHETTLRKGLMNEAMLFGECCETDDFHEGARAFLEKRMPVFKGR